MLSTIQSFLQHANAILANISESASLDAQVWLAHVVGKPRSWVLAHPEAQLSKPQIGELERGLERLADGEPLPYLIGHWEFYGLDFILTPAVLIPRPETEILVEQALNWLHAHPGANLAADVGSGSGCIAVTLASHTLDLSVIATDISFSALQITARNARKHNVTNRLHVVQTDLLAPFSPSALPKNGFDIICANPPYIPDMTLRNLKVRRWEPEIALWGGEDGLATIQPLLSAARRLLAPGGALFFEIESSQGEIVRTLAQRLFRDVSIRVIPDLAGRDRLVVIELPVIEG